MTHQPQKIYLKDIDSHKLHALLSLGLMLIIAALLCYLASMWLPIFFNQLPELLAPILAVIALTLATPGTLLVFIACSIRPLIAMVTAQLQQQQNLGDSPDTRIK